jgi:sugar lactone lactonase YvrE
LTVLVPPSLTTQPASRTNLLKSNVSFRVVAAGTGPFTYQWQFNGANLPNNLLTTAAGFAPINVTGEAYSGDGGPATSANLYYPRALCCDAIGNLYITDESNHRIRRVAANGIITTVAGDGPTRDIAEGWGPGGYSGDGGAATSAHLNYPYGAALDAAGNLYIADTDNERIRKVNTNGIITTVAGNGTNLYTGDGGPATNASLSAPTGVALDAADNLYIADQGNNRIRRVDTNGIITTVAGNGIATYAGDGGAATNASLNVPFNVAFDASGNLYVVDWNNNRIRRVDTNGIMTTVAGNGTNGYAGDGVAATNTSLNYPVAVVLDASGNLYIADGDNYRIRRVDSNGIISTVAGNGSTDSYGNGYPATNVSLDWPSGVALDAAGNLYVASCYNCLVSEVHFAGSPTLTLTNVGVANIGAYSVTVTSPAGSVTSTVATFTLAAPAAITTPPVSQIVVAGSSPGFSVAVAGSGPFGYEWYVSGTNLVQSGTNTTLLLPNVTTNNAGNYTVVITNNYGSVTSRVAVLAVVLPPAVAAQPASQTNGAGGSVSFNVAAGGTGPFACQWQFNGANLPNPNLITTVAGNGSSSFAGDGGAATSASLDEPQGASLDAFGNLYIADCLNNRIRKVDLNGIITTVAGKNGANYSGDGGAATNAFLYNPSGVSADAFGNLFVADTDNERLRKVALNGIITTVAGNGAAAYAGDGGLATNASLYYPTGAALDAAGNLYVADSENGCVREVNTAGIITTVAGNGTNGYAGDGGCATNAELSFPNGVALDASNNLYIADRGNERIRRVGTNGIISTVVGNGARGYAGDGGLATSANLDYPEGVVLDAMGNLYIADMNNERIRKVDPSGVITTVAGGGHGPGTGDGGTATNATLDEPLAVALDAVGNLYVADRNNQRIREIHFAGLPTLSFTNLSATNAGNYSVIISSPYGSVTSAVVSLTVTIPTNPPQIVVSGTSFGFQTNQFGFNLSGLDGQTIVVDGSTNLTDWTPLFTNTANGSPFYFFDPAWTNYPWRFYRARLP